MSTAARQNIEIKVRVDANDLSRIRQRAFDVNGDAAGPSTDVDTYFRVVHGRLKLRVSNNERAGTLIFYERRNEASSRLSHYRLLPISDAPALRETLALALGILVSVTKRRTVVMYGATRIHFDEVEELGSFIELETVLSTQTHAAALTEHRHVFNSLGLDAGEIVPQSYSDLLLQRGTPS